MPIRHSPLPTVRSLAARRANALKSTGPRTPSGKARASLNALKHGRSMGPAGRAPRFRERLLRAGCPQQEALYGGLRSCLAQAFGAQDPRSRRRVDQMAASAWCQAVGRRFFGTKLECALESRGQGSRVLLQECRGPMRYRAEDNWRRIGIVFWVQHRRFLTTARLKRMLAGLEPLSVPGPNEGLESRVRCRVFRLRRPGYFERLRYGLDRNGAPDWECELWRSAVQSGKVPRRRRAEARVSGPAGAALFANEEHARVRIVAEGGSSPAEASQSAKDPPKAAAGTPAEPPRPEVARNPQGGASAASGGDASGGSVSGAIEHLSGGLSRRIVAAGRSLFDGLLRIAALRKIGYIKA
jgi:hypothetical protein